MPLRFKIENRNDYTVKDVELLDCLNKLMRPTQQLFPEGVKVSIVFPENVSYERLVWEIATGTELVFLATRINYPKQTYEAGIIVRVSDLFGNSVTVPLYRSILPHEDDRAESDKGTIGILQGFMVGKSTSLILDKVEANSSVMVTFYGEGEALPRKWYNNTENRPAPGISIIVVGQDDQMYRGVHQEDGNVIYETGNREEGKQFALMLWSEVIKWSHCESFHNEKDAENPIPIPPTDVQDTISDQNKSIE